MELDLKQLWNVIRPKIWLIVACALAGAILLGVYSSFFVTPMYVSTAKLYVFNNDRQNAQISQTDLEASKQLVKTYIAIMQSDRVMQNVAKSVGLGYSAGNIRSMFSARQIDETEIFEISIRNADPAHAQKIANAILKEAPTPIIETVKAGSVQIVDRASLPKNPSSPNVRNEIIKGFLIGAVLSMAAIVAIHLLDRRIHSEEDINANYTIPVLGILPQITADQIEVKGVQNNETV